MEKIKTIVEAFDKNRDSKNGIRFIYSEKKSEFFAYNVLYQAALKMLNNLRTQGLKKGDELVFQITNNKDFIIIFWACICGGIVPVPVNYGYSRENGIKVVKIWSKLKRPHLIYSEDYFQGFIELLKDVVSNEKTINTIIENSFSVETMKKGSTLAKIENVNEKDTAYIQFSSGSTGSPKGVVLTHKNLVTNIRAIINGCFVKHNDISISWLPLTHDMGLIGMHITPLFLGCTQNNMTPTLFVKKPLLLLDKMTEYKVTMTSIPNFGFAHMMNSLRQNVEYRWDLSSMRLIFNGAEMISYELCSKFLNYMEKYKLDKLAMFPVYGMAEASVAVTFPEYRTGLRATVIDRTSVTMGSHIIDTNIEEKDKALYVELGFPIENCEIAIVDDQKNVQGNMIVGNIFIRGDNVTEGYYGEVTTKYTLINKENWLDTGDIGFVNNHGLVVLGRTKELIIINGKNYYCSDLERVVEKISGYPDGNVAVTSYFNGNTEILLAFLVNKGSVARFEEQVEKIRLDFYRQVGISIENIIPVKHLPKTTSGKIQRYKLVDNYLSGDYKNVLTEINEYRKIKFDNRKIQLPITEIEKKISSVIENKLGIEKISMNDNLFYFSLQSIQIMQIYEEINQLYPDKISLSDMFKLHTVKEIADAITSSECFEIKTNVWPESYYQQTLGIFKHHFERIVMDIQDNCYAKIKDISMLTRSNFTDVLFALVSYLYWDETTSESFAGYLVSEKEGVVAEINIHFDKIKDIYELTNTVCQKKHTEINMAKFDNVRKNREMKKLSILIYNTGLLKNSISSLPFDLLFGVTENNNTRQICLEVSYDANHIVGDKIKTFLASLKALLNEIDVKKWS
nr:AMP-binding protein [uncultured Blautia sp.]